MTETTGDQTLKLEKELNDLSLNSKIKRTTHSYKSLWESEKRSHMITKRYMVGFALLWIIAVVILIVR